MNWFRRIPLLGFVLALTMTEAASAGTRVGAPAARPSRVVATQRVVVVRPAPLWWYDPWWGPAYYPYAPTSYMGTVKIVTKRKGDSVYVDDGFAGVTGKLKKFPLTPGTHDIALRDSDRRTIYKTRVHVIAGKTVELHVSG
jgi:hypothetical protein